MKAIINGKRYDTETATHIGGASSNLAISDFGWWEENLYRTPRGGAYFLAGEGHARSHYATNLGGGSWGPGEKIVPMTRDEAFAWAQERLNPEEVEAAFPDMIADA